MAETLAVARASVFARWTNSLTSVYHEANVLEPRDETNARTRKLIANRFQLLRGLRPNVYHARDGRRHVSIELVPARDHDLATLRREIAIANAIEHPNLCRPREVVEAGEQLVIVTELVEGISIADRLRVGPFDPLQVGAMMVELLSVLDRIHAAALAHGAISPSTVVIGAAGALRLIDLGVGRGGPHPTARGDLAAVGALAATMLIGHPGSVPGTLMAWIARCSDPTTPFPDVASALAALTSSGGAARPTNPFGMTPLIRKTVTIPPRSRTDSQVAIKIPRVDQPTATPIEVVCAPVLPTRRSRTPSAMGRTTEVIAAAAAIRSELEGKSERPSLTTTMIGIPIPILPASPVPMEPTPADSPVVAASIAKSNLPITTTSAAASSNATTSITPVPVSAAASTTSAASSSTASATTSSTASTSAATSKSSITESPAPAATDESAVSTAAVSSNAPTARAANDNGDDNDNKNNEARPRSRSRVPLIAGGLVAAAAAVGILVWSNRNGASPEMMATTPSVTWISTPIEMPPTPATLRPHPPLPTGAVLEGPPPIAATDAKPSAAATTVAETASNSTSAGSTPTWVAAKADAPAKPMTSVPTTLATATESGPATTLATKAESGPAPATLTATAATRPATSTELIKPAPAKLGSSKLGDATTLQVPFSAESAWIETAGVYVLEEAYRQLVKSPLARVEVIGHASNDGKEGRNLQLAIGRALSVKNALVQRGIDVTRIAVTSRVYEVSTTDSVDDRARSRRAEIRIVPASTAPTAPTAP